MKTQEIAYALFVLAHDKEVTREEFENTFICASRSYDLFAREYLAKEHHEGGGVPNWLEPYVDFDSIGRHLCKKGFYWLKHENLYYFFKTSPMSKDKSTQEILEEFMADLGLNIKKFTTSS